MNFIYFYFVILLYFTLNCDTIFCFFEPISMGLAGIAGGVLYYVRDPLTRNTWCKVFECCNDDHIPARFDKLKYSLEEKLYGQHLAEQVVVDALAAHFSDSNPYKALTLSFHGWPGSGKNYVSKFITDALYKEGSKSKFVHHFTARIHFPLENNVWQYQRDLQSWLKGNVSSCSRSLFIFDEVDKMPENLLNAIKPMIDYHEVVEKVDYRKSVFIFLSNTGGNKIKDHLLALWEKGVKRKDVTMNDFEKMIAKGAFNEKGGFHKSDTISSNLIDHYIPFFPMEKEHVELCIKDLFKARGIYNPQEHIIRKVMDSVEWGPEPLNLFSTTGCKRLSQKVSLIARQHRMKSEL